MALLDGLDRVDWAALHHAYGPAIDVPDLLRALADPANAAVKIVEGAKRANRGITDHVQWELWGNVFHQGTRWQASSHVVPFLRELLVHGRADAKLRQFLVAYLHHLARGYPEDEFPEQFDLAGCEQAVKDGDAEYALWARDCFVAVEACVPNVLPFLDDDHEELSDQAFNLVASFPRLLETSGPVLWALYRDAKAPGRRGAALIALAQLGAPGIAEPAQVLMDASDGLDGVFAACAEALARHEQASKYARARLDAVTKKMGALSGPFTGGVATLVGRCRPLLDR